ELHTEPVYSEETISIKYGSSVTESRAYMHSLEDAGKAVVVPNMMFYIGCEDEVCSKVLVLVLIQNSPDGSNNVLDPTKVNLNDLTGIVGAAYRFVDHVEGENTIAEKMDLQATSLGTLNVADPNSPRDFESVMEEVKKLEEQKTAEAAGSDEDQANEGNKTSATTDSSAIASAGNAESASDEGAKDTTASSSESSVADDSGVITSGDQEEARSVPLSKGETSKVRTGTASAPSFRLQSSGSVSAVRTELSGVKKVKKEESKSDDTSAPEKKPAAASPAPSSDLKTSASGDTEIDEVASRAWTSKEPAPASAGVQEKQRSEEKKKTKAVQSYKARTSGRSL
ncbi:MAG: hypothetical protein KDD22_06240, partial [Bdellovibrionales bacterium]|nr:hypothetical protein [Bdellovibrionales bacterium]